MAHLQIIDHYDVAGMGMKGYGVIDAEKGLSRPALFTSTSLYRCEEWMKHYDNAIERCRGAYERGYTGRLAVSRAGTSIAWWTGSYWHPQATVAIGDTWVDLGDEGLPLINGVPAIAQDDWIEVPRPSSC